MFIRGMIGDLPQTIPDVSALGLDGVVVRFSDVLTDAANLRAIGFAAHIDGIDGVTEAASSLVSVFVRFDAALITRDRLMSILSQMAADYQGDTVAAKSLWTIPCCFDGEAVGQLAHDAGMSETALIDGFCAAPVRCLALGFAPGQPYLGLLPEALNFARRSDLTQVGQGDVVTAVRQLIVFANPSPTGWWKVGRSHFRVFDAERSAPFAFAPGDLVQFAPVSALDLEAVQGDTYGGAKVTKA